MVQVTRLSVFPDEPAWSINLKKGMLNTLQLQLRPDSAREDVQLQQVMQKLRSRDQDMYSQQSQEQSFPQRFYTIMEVSSRLASGQSSALYSSQLYLKNCAS